VEFKNKKYYNYISFSYKEKLFVGFGVIDKKVTKDLFTIVNDTFKSINIKSSNLKARKGVASATYKNYLYIFGGWANSKVEYFGDLWRLNLLNLDAWELVDHEFGIGKRANPKMVIIEEFA